MKTRNREMTYQVEETRGFALIKCKHLTQRVLSEKSELMSGISQLFNSSSKEIEIVTFDGSVNEKLKVSATSA